jgi:hypothetical protein
VPVQATMSPVAVAFLLLIPSLSAPNPVGPSTFTTLGRCEVAVLLGIGRTEAGDADAVGCTAVLGADDAAGGVSGPAGPSARGTFDAQPVASRAAGRRTDPRTIMWRMAW